MKRPSSSRPVDVGGKYIDDLLGETSMILYHYCSNAAFHSIITNRSVHLSSLSLSNDSKEGRLVADGLIKMAKESSLTQRETAELQRRLSYLSALVDGLGFCLSKKGDLLSQWRGYADDAFGVSIGFEKDYLKKLSMESFATPEIPYRVSLFVLQQVVYDPDKQTELLADGFVMIRSLIQNGAFKEVSDYSYTEVSAMCDGGPPPGKEADLELVKCITDQVRNLYKLKSGAFSEEQEWRLLSYFFKTSDDEDDICLFRPCQNSLIPYKELPLLELDCIRIKKVVLGPKNRTPVRLVENFLKQNGFGDVEVSQSVASYC